ncbi:MAG: cupredoxin family protein [Burkholderiales bacterium]|nr:cupredoxin family protein [Burkholderiales bacterium]
MRRLHPLLLALAGVAPLIAHAHDEARHAPSPTLSTHAYAFGVQGDPKASAHTVTVVMDDRMRFTPASIPVRQGETISFVVRNEGKLLHELVIGTPADLARHAETMRKHPGMAHDEPFMVHVKPGAAERLTWRFTKSGRFEFACLVPGHYEAGMKGMIAVAARTDDATPPSAGSSTSPAAAARSHAAH